MSNTEMFSRKGSAYSAPLCICTERSSSSSTVLTLQSLSGRPQQSSTKPLSATSELSMEPADWSTLPLQTRRGASAQGASGGVRRV